jgi:hypothetical protein
VDGEAGVFAQLVASGLCQVVGDHFRDQVLERDLGGPAQFFSGFGRVAQEGVHLCGAEIRRVYLNNGEWAVGE